MVIILTGSTLAYADNACILSQVRVNDGVNLKEAGLIAQAFFISQISGCGFPLKVEDGQGKWVAKTRVGYDGSYGKPIHIDKRTGNISWASTFVSFQNLKNKLQK